MFDKAYWPFLFGILVTLFHSENAEKYENHALLNLIPFDEQQFQAVRRFADSEGQIEILKRSYGLNDSLDVLVPPEKLQFIHDFAEKNHLETNVKTLNYAAKLKFDREPKRRTTVLGFEYLSFDAINNILEALSSSSKFLELEHVGDSYEGRPIKLAKISSNPFANNPIIFVDAGIHAREWVAPAMAVYMINRLVTDPSSRQDLEGIDWYILPVVNPDGYEFTRSKPNHRLWRKTRSQSTPLCYGVDGNRNYGFKWAVSGVSNNPCNKETYAGPRPFSEPETRNVRKIMHKYADRIKLYVSMHAYGQYLVYPWGYTGHSLPKSWKKLDRLARIVSGTIVGAGGPPFQVLSAGKWYPAAGGSDDYAFGAVGIPYSYTMELTDGYEFTYPQELLPAVLPKFYLGFRAFANEIRNEFGVYRERRDSLNSYENSTLTDEEEN